MEEKIYTFKCISFMQFIPCLPHFCQNELQLKNREDEEYSIYSFDIKKTDSYKVLYFQNNEVLNYFSFYAAPAVSAPANIVIKNIEYKKKTTVRELQAGYYYAFRVDVDEDSKITIEIKVSTSYNPSFQVDVAFLINFQMMTL